MLLQKQLAHTLITALINLLRVFVQIVQLLSWLCEATLDASSLAPESPGPDCLRPAHLLLSEPLHYVTY